MDPCQVDASTSFSQPSSTSSKELPPTPEKYPQIRFWDREDWDKYLESPEGQNSKRGTMGYLEDGDGKAPSVKKAKAIRKLLHGGWVELVHRELAPPSWGRLFASACQFIHNLMESTFQDFKFANNGWKLDYLASTTYPAWWKGKLDENGRWKPKKGKGVKIEDDDKDDEDEDDSTDEVGMKWKALAFKSEGPGPEKRFKGACCVRSLIHPANMKYTEDDLMPSSSTTSLSPPPSDTSKSSSNFSTESLLPVMPGVLHTSVSDNDEATPFSETPYAHVAKESNSDPAATIISINPLWVASDF